MLKIARISKRGSWVEKETGKQTSAGNHEKRYKAGIYARLSSDQDVKKNESVDVQIEIAKEYVEKFNREKAGEMIEVVECYIDLGKTGSNFEREGFKRLLQDIRLGDINCVIVKDLSRFGRNYLEAGNYIEKIFPFLGVRFIAVADGYDTGKEGNEKKQMASEIQNLVNDMYAKDFSKKAKIHLKQRREEGSYVGGPPPYGYMVQWNGKKRVLIPDDNTAVVVQFIYEKFVETENCAAVCDELNKRRIHPPVVYKKTKEVYASRDEKEYKGWDKSSVERILKSSTYLGTLVQGKTSITARDEKKRIHKPENEWVVTKNSHEPLIDEKLYHKVEKIWEKIAKRSASHKHPARGYPIEENRFDSVLHCGVCGRKMIRSSYVKIYADGEKARLEGYFCLNGGQTKVTVCPASNRISKTELVNLLLPLLRKEFEVFLENKENDMEFWKEQVLKAVKKETVYLQKMQKRKRHLLEEEANIYMDYRLGKLSQKDYEAYKRQKGDQRSDLIKTEELQKKERENLKKRSEEYLLFIKAIFNLEAGSDLTKELIEALILKIYVYPGKRMEVFFAFAIA